MNQTRFWLLLIASCLLGVFAGAIGDEVHHRTEQQSDKAIFAAKLRCQRLGEKYSSENSTPPFGPVPALTTAVFRIDYSPVVHSCIAETESNTGADFINYRVVDIVTGELYGGSICKNGDDCDRKSSEIGRKEDEIFDRAIAGKIKPLSR